MSTTSQPIDKAPVAIPTGRTQSSAPPAPTPGRTTTAERAPAAAPPAPALPPANVVAQLDTGARQFSPLREPTARGATTPRQAADSVPLSTTTRAQRARGDSAAAALTALGFEVRVDPTGALRARGRLAGHPLPVSVFAPAHLDPRAPVDLVMHLHGFTFGATPQDAVHGRFDFARMLAAAGRNAILVVPESEDRCRTFNAWTPAALQELLGSIAHASQAAGLVRAEQNATQAFRSLTVTSHSGAYLATSRLAELLGPYSSRLLAVGLFDSNYASQDASAQRRLAELASRLNGRGGVFASVYLNNSPTAAPSEQVSRALSEIHRRPATQVSELPAHHVPGAILSLGQPPRGAESHYEILRRHFAPFLATALPEPDNPTGMAQENRP